MDVPTVDQEMDCSFGPRQSFEYGSLKGPLTGPNGNYTAMVIDKYIHLINDRIISSNKI